MKEGPMSKTKRYTKMEEYLGKRVKLQVRFSKYGAKPGESTKVTCLKNIMIDNKFKIDHIWVISKELMEAKLKTNQRLLIEATVKSRLRPAENIFEDPIQDITLHKVKILKNKGR
jgi:hypothetical protein